jgi:hypothetical protein
MQHLIDNRDAAIEMGRRGRRQVETVNGPDAHYEQTMAVYESLTHAAPRPVAPLAEPAA